MSVTQKCSISGQTFTITDSDLAFYEKMGVPTPTLCPEERLRLRLSFRNRRNMYARNCDSSGKKLISMFAPERPFPVYHISQWHKDEIFDPFAYGIDFDFSRTFTEQYKTILERIPHPHAAISGTNENAEYCNGFTNIKDCYLAFGINDSERVHCSDNIVRCYDCIDCFVTDDCELCYECIDCANCYQCTNLQRCKNCSDSHFLQDCIGCQNCFGCVNLRNKEYHYLNQPLKKEAYEQRIQELDLGSFSKRKDLQAQFLAFAQKYPKKYINAIQYEDSTGDDLANVKNCHECFCMADAEDCRHCFWLKQTAKDCHDCTYFGLNINVCYQCANCGHNIFNLKFCTDCYNSQDLEYCMHCPGGKKSFGCFGLKNKKPHCLFNKAYSQHEYETLRQKVVSHMQETGEWGQWFHPSLCPFPYNKSVAYEYLDPLSQDEALKRGYHWEEAGTSPLSIRGDTGGIEETLPDNISSTPASILSQTLYCQKTHKPYKISKAEYKFYQKMNLPIPRYHLDVRYQNRLHLRNHIALHSRPCDQCQTPLSTTYSPDRPEKILCESCYLKAVN